MMSSCIPISGQTHKVCPTNHSKLSSSISSRRRLPKGKECRFSSNILDVNLVSLSGLSFSSKIPAAANQDFAIDGGEKERLGQNVLLQPERMPKHVALFTDGHRRWAAKNGLSIEDGNRAGVRRAEELARLCHRLGIEVLTIFCFSTQNWVRSKEEVDAGMSLFEEYAALGLEIATEYKPRISVIGDTSKLPETLRRWIATGEGFTKRNKGLHILTALNYGGRQDIVEAAKEIAAKVKDGKMSVEEIDEKNFGAELQTKCTHFPCPDLFIRRGGKKKISNFMLWQMAYTELYFADKLFPDFGEEDFMEAIVSYQQRQRRFGGYKHES